MQQRRRVSRHGVQSLGPPDQEAVEEGREGLPLGAPEGATGQVVVEGGGYGGGLEFLEDTLVGCRSSGMASGER